MEKHHINIEKIKSDTRKNFPISSSTDQHEGTINFFSGEYPGCWEQDPGFSIYNHHGCQQSEFDILVQEGNVGAGTLEEGQASFNNDICRAADGFAGDAITNDTVADYSHIIFGFWTHHLIPVDGEPVRYHFMSQLEAYFPLLEAMSLAPGCQGAIDIRTNLYFFYGDYTDQAGSQLIAGASPPIYAIPGAGETSTIWNPENERIRRGTKVRADINDSHSDRWVSMFESIELTAIRFGDVNHCNALGTCKVNFLPPVSLTQNLCTNIPI